MRDAAVFWAAWCVALLVGSGQAWAGPLEVFGTGGEASAQGSAQGARPEGSMAVAINPGALALQERSLSVGMIAAFTQAEILLHARPPGYDVPDLGSDSPALPSSRTPRARQDTTSVSPLYGITVGGVTGLGFERVRFGATAFLPAGELLALDSHFVDERERFSSNRLYFELLDRRLRRMDLQFGAGWRLLDWLGVGMGMTMVPGAALANDVYLQDPTNQADIDLNLKTSTDFTWGWSAGATIEVARWLAIGLTYKSDVAVRVSGANRIYVLGAEGDEGGYVIQRFDLVPSYSPALATLGLASTLGRWSLSLDGQWTQWSRYRDTHNEDAGFDDTLSWRLGAQVRLSERMTGNMGLSWAPSPVPEQTGRSNYVDNDRLVLSAGTGHEVDLGGKPARVSWFMQLHALRTRHTTKATQQAYPECAPGVRALCDEVPDDTTDGRTGVPYEEARGLQTGNPGFPGFSSGGWMGVLGVAVTFARDRSTRVQPTLLDTDNQDNAPARKEAR